MLPLQGLSQGAQPIVSFNYGAGNADRVKKAFFFLLKACLAYSTLLWGISVFRPQLFISIFTSDPELTTFTIWVLTDLYGHVPDLQEHRLPASRPLSLWAMLKLLCSWPFCGRSFCSFR